MNQSLPALQALDVAKLIAHTIDSATDYLKAREIEKTERQRIVACLKALTKKMEVDRSNFETFITASFAERERLYKTMEAVMNKGLQENNFELVKHASQVMLSVYHKNPLDGFQDVSQGVQMNVLQPIRHYIED